MNTNTKKGYDIVNGPSRESLVDAFKYAYDKQSRVNVAFHVAVGYTGKPGDPTTGYVRMHIKDIRIARIEHEDGSGTSFNLDGYCYADLESVSSAATYKRYNFKAYYNAKSRKGYIEFFG